MIVETVLCFRQLLQVMLTQTVDSNTQTWSWRHDYRRNLNISFSLLSPSHTYTSTHVRCVCMQKYPWLILYAKCGSWLSRFSNLLCQSRQSWENCKYLPQFDHGLTTSGNPSITIRSPSCMSSWTVLCIGIFWAI